MFKKFTLNIKGRLFVADRPQIMGIINVTPDSFYSGSRTLLEADIRSRVERMLEEGVDIVDIGAYSSRPGAADVTPSEEWRVWKPV